MGSPRGIEPDHFGPLTEGEDQQHGDYDLFPGEDRFLRVSLRRQKLKLWQAVSPRVEPLLEADEHVLYVAVGHERLSILKYLALGWLTYRYFQVALVLTDRRLVEVLLGFRGVEPESRVRSIRWNAVTALAMRLGKFVVRPAAGRKLGWTPRHFGDRKVLKILASKLSERLPGSSATSAGAGMSVHCSGCPAELHDASASCPACGAIARSGRLASLLSLAFPGAGLYYLGHNILATVDLLAELLLFGVVVLIFALEPDAASRLAAVYGTGLLILLTKIESVHIVQVLAARRRPETPQRRSIWRRLAWIGGGTSLVAVLVASGLGGILADVVDRELEFTRAGPAWSWTRNPEEMEFFSEDPDVRTQWFHEDGWIVTVLAYPFWPADNLPDLATQFEQDGFEKPVWFQEGDGIPSSMQGFHALHVTEGEDGFPSHSINYVVHDPVGDDVHLLVTVTTEDKVEEAHALIRFLLVHSTWMDSTEGVRGPE